MVSPHAYLNGDQLSSAYGISPCVIDGTLAKSVSRLSKELSMKAFTVQFELIHSNTLTQQLPWLNGNSNTFAYS